MGVHSARQPRGPFLIRLGVMLCLVSSVASAAVDPAALHKKARTRMKSLDFDAALPLLEQLKGEPSLSAQQRVDVLIDLGITHVNLGQAEEARRDFEDVLALNPNARPSPSTSPKVQRLFDEVKEAREIRLRPPPPPEPKPEPPPPPPKLEPAPRPEPLTAPVSVEEAPAAPRQRLVAVPLVLMLAGAGAVAAGVVCAMQSQGAARELQGSLHSTAEVTALENKRSTFAALTYTGYGVGGALAVTGAALLIFSGTF